MVNMHDMQYESSFPIRAHCRVQTGGKMQTEGKTAD